MANNHKDFFDNLYKAAPSNMRGLYMSVMMAQAAIESTFGTNWLATKYNNYFGIKANAAWNGQRVNAYTHEVVNGSKVGQYSDFRAYDSLSDGIKDYVNFLYVNKRYEKAGVFLAGSPEDEARALQAAGYATATSYANTIIKYINNYNLTAYNKKKSGVGYIN